MKEEKTMKVGEQERSLRYKTEDETKVLIKPHLLHAWQRVAHCILLNLPP